MVHSSRLTFSLVPAGDRVRLRVTGELDLSTRESFISAALGALEATPALLELDFAGVAFCDSSGVSGLLAVHRMAAGAGKRVVLANLRPQLVLTLSVAGLLDTLTAVESD
jgi:anti-anti-sigma factor